MSTSKSPTLRSLRAIETSRSLYMSRTVSYEMKSVYLYRHEPYHLHITRSLTFTSCNRDIKIRFCDIKITLSICCVAAPLHFSTVSLKYKGIYKKNVDKTTECELICYTPLWAVVKEKSQLITSRGKRGFSNIKHLQHMAASKLSARYSYVGHDSFICVA